MQIFLIMSIAILLTLCYNVLSGTLAGDNIEKRRQPFGGPGVCRNDGNEGVLIR